MRWHCWPVPATTDMLCANWEPIKKRPHGCSASMPSKPWKALKAVLSGTGLEYPRTHNLVMLSELLRTAAIDLPPDVDDFGRLVPYGVVLRYGDATTDDPPPMESAWFESVVTRTIDWASEYLNLKRD
jgi:hypothetical protein